MAANPTDVKTERRCPPAAGSCTPMPPAPQRTITQPQALPPPPRSRTAWWSLLLLGIIAIWSIQSTGTSIPALIAGRDEGFKLVKGLFPPELSPEFLRQVAWATVETIQISIASLILAAVLAAPLSLLIARNIGAPTAVRCAARYLASSLRAAPELLLALVFVATVGLGAPAGVFAIGLHGAGLLAKLWAEQFEGADPLPIEAMRLTGASRSATAVLAIVPTARNGLVSLVLYQWECNIRTAVVVGFVGAGGIGEGLVISLRLFRYGELSTLLIAVVALTIGVDFVSRTLRRRLGAAA